jgi:hypothetical protein
MKAPLQINSPAKALGLWASIAGMLTGLLVSSLSVDTGPAQPVADTPGPIEVPALQVAAINVPAGAALRRIDFSDAFDWMEIQVPPKTPAVRRAKTIVAELQEKKKALQKALAARGKKAERLFHPIILRAAHRHRVDPAMVQAIIMAESSFNPAAISEKGAIGLMQLMPGTAASLGIENVFDPEHNINGGVLYFRRLLNKFEGNVKLALAAYNAGSRKVTEHRGVPPFTQAYIKKVFEYYHRYKHRLNRG